MIPMSTKRTVRFTPRRYMQDESSAPKKPSENAAAEAASDGAGGADASAPAEPKAGKPPVYILAVPSVLQRTEINAVVVEAGVRPVTVGQLREALRGVLPTLVSGDALGRYLEALDRLEAAGDETDASAAIDLDTIDPADKALLTQAENVAMADPGYARLLAMQARWWPYIKYFAVKHLLRGWENIDAKFEMTDGLAGDDSLSLIDPDDYDEVGAKAVTLMHPTGDDLKN